MVLLYGCFLISHGIGSPEMLTSSIYSMYIGLGFRYIFNIRSIMSTYTELIKVNGIYEGVKEILGPLEHCPIYNNK